MAEHDGFAVECRSCKGAGKQTYVLEWDDFDGRKVRDDVHTVVRVNPGICLGGNSNFGGIPYDSWLAGACFLPGSEDREHTCPAWFYQSADCEQKPEWDECHSSWGRGFSTCKHFQSKSVCWKRWDLEFT